MGRDLPCSVLGLQCPFSRHVPNERASGHLNIQAYQISNFTTVWSSRVTVWVRKAADTTTGGKGMVTQQKPGKHTTNGALSVVVKLVPNESEDQTIDQAV